MLSFPAVEQQAGGPAPRPCYWAQAQVVRHKACTREFQCQSCPFDRALRKQAAVNAARKPKGEPRLKDRIETWQDKLRQLPALQRPCIHTMRGEITFRPCTENYLCAECSFHQYFQDIYSVHTVLSPIDLLECRGFHIPQGYYLHPGHAWVKLESEDTVRIGLDQFALKILGPLDCIDIPVLGKRLTQDQPGFILHREGHSIAVLSPVSGVITDVQTELGEHPAPALDDPYGQGWLVRVKASDLRRELPGLILGMESEDFLSQSVNRVFSLLEEKYGPLAADGGDLAPDLAGQLPEMSWEKLAEAVLRP
ncbi:glycine cleavage system protein H [Desulfovermiculus halophilus]|uniref:glycine cleavage system protein H n=1 Tax=Desulfovermiculus halophilus TaxID=339722 RepID=UPI000685348D|nr:glycine cleavage system protein H [Desulfovermiculus halophilus]